MEEHPNEKLFFEEVSKHNFRIISVKKDYMQSRLKLEHSMVLFFAFDVYDTIQENSHWLFFLDELKEAFSKYLEIVLFTNNADKKLVEALLQEGENDISHIDYPRAILCHTHLNDPIVLNEFEPFDIYKTIEQWDQFYKEEFPIEKEKKFQQIRNLLNSYPVVIFIKGSPHDPFCKFSKSFIEIIRETGIRYKSFDIFKDDSLRCYLRLYSGWKTYPQFYVNGKVIGGLDVLKQLVASGEIDQVIPFECTKEATSVRIQEILKNNVLVTFSKGTLENKKCKSSNEVFEIFDKLGLKYTCFDVLTDEQARDYLKESYNYPYFPQIVYHFNLLGGVKFLKEKVTKGTIFEHIALSSHKFFIENKKEFDQIFYHHQQPSCKNANLLLFVVRLYDESNTEAKNNMEQILKKEDLKNLQEVSVKEHSLLKTFLIDILGLNKKYDFLILHDYLIINENFRD